MKQFSNIEQVSLNNVSIHNQQGFFCTWLVGFLSWACRSDFICMQAFLNKHYMYGTDFYFYYLVLYIA